MAKQQRLNKALIAALTVSGIFLSVVVVGVASWNFSKRDPVALAQKAKEQEAAGNIPRAVEFWGRAWGVSRDVNYLLEAARCAYTLGDLIRMIEMLKTAQSADPDNAAVLESLLKKFLFLNPYLNEDLKTDLRDASADLLTIDPNNVLALVARSEALSLLTAQDPSYARLADEAFEKATSLAPSHAEVALLRYRRNQREMESLAAGHRGRQMPPAVVSRLEALRADSIEALRAAAAVEPTHVELATTLAEELLLSQDAAAARETLETAVGAGCENPRVLGALAERLLNEARSAQGGGTTTAPASAEAALARARELAQRAIERERAYSTAYRVLAESELVGLSQNELTPADIERFNKSLDVLEQALEKSVGSESLEAVLEERTGGRIRLTVVGFDLATEFLRRAGVGEHRLAALARMKQFVNVATAERPDFFMTAILEGELARHEGDRGRAISALVRAEQALRGISGLENYMALVAGRLGRLYRDVGEDGTAMQYLDQAIRLANSLGRNPDAPLFIDKAEILRNFKRYNEALDVLEELDRRYPNYPASKRLRVSVLSSAGREREANALLKTLEGEGSAEQLFAAYMETTRGNHAAALAILLKLLDPNAEESLGPRTGDALRMLAAAASAEGKADLALPVLRAHRERAGSEAEKRSIDLYEIILTVADAQERAAKILKLIEQIPDEAVRNAELFAYYWQNEDLEKASQYLDLVEKARPNDRQVLDQQFNLWIRREQLDRAENYAARLASMNADRAGGAVYRAVLRQAQKQFDAALQEYRAAEQALGRDSDLKVRIAQMLLSTSPPRFDEAQRELLQAVEFNPRHFLANKLLFAIYEQQGRREEGVAYLKRAAEIQPNDPYIAERKEFMDEELDPRAGIARREAKRKEVPDDLENLIRLGELHAKLAVDKSVPEVERETHTAQARASFATALERDPASPRLARSAARFYSAPENRPQTGTEGLDLLDRHIAATSGVDRVAARLLKARYLERLPDPAAAEAELLAVETAVPELVEADKVRSVELDVAVELVDFYSRWRKADLLVAACRKAMSKADDKAVRQRLQLQTIEGLAGLQEFAKAREELDVFQKEAPDDLSGIRLRIGLILDEASPTPEKRLEALLNASDQLSRVLRTNPNDVWALTRAATVQLELARFHGRREGLTQAREMLLKAKELAPTGFNLLHRRMLVQLYEVTGESTLAEQELRELADLVPNDMLVANTYIDYLVSHEKPDKAQEFVLTRIRTQPGNPLWHYQHGRLLLRRGQFAAAIEPLRRAIELLRVMERYDSAVEADLMRALNGSKQPRESLSFYQKRLVDEPDSVTPETRILAAEAYIMLNQRDQAIQEVRLSAEAATRSLPEVNTPYVGASAVRLLGEKDGSAVLRDVISKTAEEPGAMLLQVRLAGVLSESKEAEARAESRRLIEDLLNRAEKGSPARLEALYLRAYAAEAENDTKTTRDSYEEILRHEPQNMRALNNLAYFVAGKMKNPAEALTYAERLHQIATRGAEAGRLSSELQASVLDTVGWVYHLNQRDQQAELLLTDAMRLNPQSVEIRRHLATVLASQNRKSDARRILESARDMARAQQNAADVLEAIEKELNELR